MSWITGWLILIAVFHFYLKLCLNQSSQRMSTVSLTKKIKIAVDLSNQDFNEENKKSQLKYFFEKLRFHPNSFPSIPNLVPCVSSTFSHLFSSTRKTTLCWCSDLVGQPRMRISEFHCAISEMINIAVLCFCQLVLRQSYHTFHQPFVGPEIDPKWLIKWGLQATA